MSDIFISYAKEDREWVVSFAEALRQQGWTVWWDRSIPFGQSFQEVIEKELNEAQCAIVVWSKHSVGSSWVSAEADEARNRNIMVPVLIDDVSPPLVFRQLQTANLEGWNNDTSSPVFKKLIADIAVLLGQPVTQSRFSEPTSQAHTSVEKKPHKWIWATGLIGVLGVVATLWYSNLQEPSPVAESPIINEFRVENPRIKTGDTSNLIWSTSNASTVEIRELGDVAHSGTSRIRPEKTSVYTLIVRNSNGETTQGTVEVIVENQQVEEKAPKVIPDPGQLISLFNESFEEGRLDLAEQFLEKAIKMTPDHPEVLRIKDQFDMEITAQQLAEKEQQKAQKLAEQESLKKEQETKLLEQKLAEQRRQEGEQRVAEEKKRQEEANKKRVAEQLREEQLQKQADIEKARIVEIKKHKEAERLNNDEIQREQQAQMLADQQRRKEEELRKKADQQRLVEIENQKKIEAEKQRQQDLEKQKALATPAPIAIEVKGVDKKFKRYGLLESTLRESVAQQLQAAGFNVVSIAEAKSSKDSVVMQLRFKYIERNYGAGELYTYSATTYIFPGSSTKGEVLWKQRVESMANILELGKVNKEFAKNVQKFIRDHPEKGLEFKK